MSAILSERHGAVLVLTLNRVKYKNSLNAEVYSELTSALRAAESDDGVRAVITRANGAAFSVGADAGNLDGYSARGLTQTFDEDFRDKVGVHAGPGGLLEDLGIGRWVLAVASFQKPWIAAVQGAAAGGGFALAMLHHFRIASDKARFVAAFGKLGLGPELGISATLQSACGLQKAMDILLTSRVVEAREAHAIGIVDRLVANESLESDSMQFAQELARQAPLAVRAAIRQLRRGWLHELREQLEVEWRDQSRLFATEDFREGIAAFTSRRDAVFSGR